MRRDHGGSQTMLRAAERYIDRGIAVFPVGADKIPLIKSWPTMATLDPAQARDWWRKWDTANIGLLCSWFFAVDIDPRNGGDRTLVDLVNTHGPLPVTWEQQSGSRGTHYLYRHHPALEAIPLGSLDGGIDIKGAGRHYILGAPSRSSKGPYRWVRGPRDCEIADAPEWLISLIVATKRLPEPAPAPPMQGDHSSRLERARRYARTLDPAIEGSNGSRATFVAAAKIARGFGLSEAEAYAVLATEWNPHCSPPWREQDLRRQVARAAQVSTFPVGGLLENR